MSAEKIPTIEELKNEKSGDKYAAVAKVRKQEDKMIKTIEKEAEIRK